MQELFLKPIIVSKDDMDRFGKNEMKKIRPIKNTWYDQLINYISEPKRKSVCGFKGKIVSLFKTNTPKQNVYGRLSKSKAQNIRNPFMLKKKKKTNKDRVIRDIRKLFEQQKQIIINLKDQTMSGTIIILNMKVMMRKQKLITR